MSGKSYTVDLDGPSTDSLRLAPLLRVLRTAVNRDLLGLLLADEEDDQGLIEHPATTFARVGNGEVAQGLTDLRSVGWVHQRPGRSGLLTRLRRDDLDARFPGLCQRVGPWLSTPRVTDTRGARRRRSQVEREIQTILDNR